MSHTQPSSDSEPWDVFLSYVRAEDRVFQLSSAVPDIWFSEQHKSFPELLKAQLHELDPSIRCFIDRVELQQGDEWQEKLEIALRSSRILVAFITPGFAKSKWCVREVSLADDCGITIMPINMLPQGSEWPPHGLLALATTQYIPFHAGPLRVAQQIQRSLTRDTTNVTTRASESEAFLISQLMESVFNCQSRLSGLANAKQGFMFNFFHHRALTGEAAAASEGGAQSMIDKAVSTRFDREYALLNTLFVLIEPFYYVARAKREISIAVLTAGTGMGEGMRTQQLARHLNDIEFAWSSEAGHLGTMSGVWQLFKGEQRALGELLDDGLGRCLSYVRFKQILIEGAPKFVTNICNDPPSYRDYEAPNVTTLTDSPLRFEVHKLLRDLRGAADLRVLPPATRCRLITVQRAMVRLLDYLDPGYVHYPTAALRRLAEPPKGHAARADSSADTAEMADTTPPRLRHGERALVGGFVGLTTSAGLLVAILVAAASSILLGRRTR